MKEEKSTRKDNKQPADPFAERRSLTFEQAEGVEPLPSQLGLKEVSPALRAAAWKLVLRSIQHHSHQQMYGRHVVNPWKQILEDRHVYRLHRPIDEFSTDLGEIETELKPIFMAGSYVQILGFFAFVIAHPNCPYEFAERVNGVLNFAHSPYRVHERIIVPFGSAAELETVKAAFADLAASEFHGARQHLRNAAEQLTAGKYPDSIRESIHAVESVTRVLEPAGDFGKALARLETKVKIHGGMKAGFRSLYGFTSDEKGIRHPLLDDPESKVDEADALFMIGACASFVSFLINKARLAGLLPNRPQRQ
jgi:hypothetical protein